ncbi:thioesterase [Musa troglodytarum]|uniref:Thioesterase n=1 Tax=Musa troglodytarum TaxID=320322 RepID=A0A9E7L4E1_9LILI|nr:thioesterase [Musa troglodytarum]
MPSQSRMSIIYNFSSDYILREHYRDPRNEVRIGKLLEDLDVLAGTIAMKVATRLSLYVPPVSAFVACGQHCSDDDSTTRPLLLVTASVDKMVLKRPLRVDTDLKIAGAFTWVGHSSIEVQIEVIQQGICDDSICYQLQQLSVHEFSYSYNDRPNSSLLNSRPETEQEKLLFEEGEERDKVRKGKREEQKRTFDNDRDSIQTRDTKLENLLICQPQQRNFHCRIFGGFLMNLAFELAFLTAYAFVGQVPCFLEVDHVDFLKPVDLRDFLRLKSCVLYTQLDSPAQSLINVEVVAYVMRPELRTSEISNTFSFTFTVNRDARKNGLKIRNVVPATEEEARPVLEQMDADKIFA